MADKTNGRLDVISEFKRDPKDNNRIAVVTVTPETKNRASYYTLMFGSDAAKAISDLRYQDFVSHRDNPESQTVEREFFLCPVEARTGSGQCLLCASQRPQRRDQCSHSFRVSYQSQSARQTPL